jgi:hypothetical protein
MTKASDLRSLFGRPARLYLHTDAKRNRVVQGTRSRALTFDAPLCDTCNNERTQPDDLAWETLSRYLQDRQPPLKMGDRIPLVRVFPGRVHSSMLGVHLYFVKLFGCLIAQHDIPIDLGAFRRAIMERRAHPNVHLAFWAVSWGYRAAGHTPVETMQAYGRVAFATWFYEVGPIAVNVMFAEPGQRRRGLTGSWHPDNLTKLVPIFGSY